jgi:hypothetical protein
MFEALSDKLKKVLKDLRGESRLSQEHLDLAMREIRIALLEADVNFKVVKDFIERCQDEGTRSGSDGIALAWGSRSSRSFTMRWSRCSAARRAGLLFTSSAPIL